MIKMAIEITKELLADLKAKAKNATPGPWEACSCAVCLPERNNKQEILGGFNDYGDDNELNERFGFGYHNAEFVAAANPQVVLALVEKIERLEEDFDTAAKSAADESAKVVRLDMEANWLASNLAECKTDNSYDLPFCPFEIGKQPDYCDYDDSDEDRLYDAGCDNEMPCSHKMVDCWREAARKTIDKKYDDIKADQDARENEAYKQYWIEKVEKEVEEIK